MKKYKTLHFELVEPDGIIPDIPHKIGSIHRDAIMSIENNHFAYLQCYRKHMRDKYFNCYINYEGETYNLITDFDNPFGKLHTIKSSIKEEEQNIEVRYNLLPNDLRQRGYRYQTFCVVNVSAFLFYAMGYTDGTAPDYKYGMKHPIYYLCQKSANENVRRLRTETMDETLHGYKFEKVSLIKAVENTLKGGLSIAAYEGEKYVDSKGKKCQKTGHVNIILGMTYEALNKESVLYDYFKDNTMTYNVGSKNGYMPIEEAFGEGKEIEYYILLKEE